MTVNLNVAILAVFASFLLPRPAMAEGPAAESAIVVLEVRFVQGKSTSVGTGFLVDNSGLIVTADHVMRGYQAKNAAELSSSSYSPTAKQSILSLYVWVYGIDKPFEFTGKQLQNNLRLGAPDAGGAGVDVAAFRVPLPDQVRKKIQPLDIAKQIPGKGTRYWVGGPTCKENTPKCRQPQLVGNANISTNTLGVSQYLVNASMAESFSGGPLITEEGLVVGLTSWGNIDFEGNASSAWFTSGKEIHNFLSDASRIPQLEAVDLNNDLCSTDGPYFQVPWFTAMEFIHSVASKAQIDNAQCDCCCKVLSQLKLYAPDMPEVSSLNCSPKSQCEEIRYAKVRHNYESNPRASTLDRAFNGYVDLHEQLVTTESISAKGDEHDQSIAKLLVQGSGGGIKQDINYQLASAAVLVNLRDVSAERPSVESFQSMEQLFLNEDSKVGEESAQKLIDLTRENKTNTPEFNAALTEADRAIRVLMMRSSVSQADLGTDGTVLFTATSMVTVGSAGHGASYDCGDKFNEFVNKLKQQIQLVGVPLGDYIGPLTTLTGTFIAPELQTTFAAYLEQDASTQNNYSRCVLLGIVIPTRATVVRFGLAAAERNEPEKPCTGTGALTECAVGLAAFKGKPEIVAAGRYQVMLMVFSNRSDSSPRQARFQVEFTSKKGG